MQAFRYFYFIILILIIPFAGAATLSGTVYDNTLNIVTDAVVTIDTAPKQQFVAKNGSYTFEIPPGSYTLEVQYLSELGDSITQSEQVLVEQEGEFVFDVIVFEGLDDVVILKDEIEDIDQDLQLLEQEDISFKYWIIAFVAILLMGIILIVIGFLIAPKKHVDDLLEDDANKVVKYIKEHNGRVTQKMLREKFPFSEAKISLIVSELEHNGILQKIKKGKGNIIILK